MRKTILKSKRSNWKMRIKSCWIPRPKDLMAHSLVLRRNLVRTPRKSIVSSGLVLPISLRWSPAETSRHASDQRRARRAHSGTVAHRLLYQALNGRRRPQALPVMVRPQVLRCLMAADPRKSRTCRSVLTAEVLRWLPGLVVPHQDLVRFSLTMFFASLLV